MERAYKNIWVLFFLILSLIFLGFFRSYFSLFPDFDNISFTQHFHSLVFLIWFAILFVQPFLIKNGKNKLHRLLGKFSIVIAACLFISIYGVAKGQYYRELAVLPRWQCIANLIIPLPQIILFLTLYFLALLNTANTGFHMRYIIGSTLVLLGPGLGRVFISWFNMTFTQAVMSSFIVTELLVLGFIIYDIKNGRRFKPFTVLLLMLLICHIAWLLLPQTVFWQKICGGFVNLAF